MEVLYIWTQFLKEESLKFLNIETSLDVSVIYTKQISYLERKNKKQKSSKLLKIQEAQKIEDGKAKGVNNVLLNDQNQEIDCENAAGKENARRAVIVTSTKDKTSQSSTSSSALHVGSSVKNGSPATAAGMVYCSSNDVKQPQLEIQAAGTTYVKPDYSLESKLHRSPTERQEVNQRHQHEIQLGSKRLNEKSYHGGYEKNQQSSQQNIKQQSTKQYREEFSYSNDCSNIVCIRNQKSQNSKYRYQSENFSDKMSDKQHQDENPSLLTQCGRQEYLRPDDRTVLDLPLTESVCLSLQHYNQEQRVVVFGRSLQECTVCFSSKLGSDCIQFDKCGHIFCKACITGYFEVQIRDGNVKSLKCLEDKCDTEANPSQVIYFTFHD